MKKLILLTGQDCPLCEKAKEVLKSLNLRQRGVKIIYIHFHSSPATNRQSIENCKQILTCLSKFQIKSKLYIYPILDIQKKIMNFRPIYYD